MKKAAEVLEDNKENILDTWIEKIKDEVMASRLNNELALRDHLPHLLQDIIGIMSRFDKFDTIGEEVIYKEIFDNSIEHGRHRATSTGYTVDQILREYIVFHRIITDLLMKEKVYTTDVGVVLKYSIENAMLYSGVAFSDSLQEMRLKLIGIVAHDIRNPIAAAFLAIDMMNYEDGKERFEKIKKMARSSIKRSVDLVEGLLDSITVEAGEGITLEFEQVDLFPSIQSVFSEALQIYSNPLNLECREKEVIGIFDATMLRRVLENFLSNAIKYGSRDKPVTVSVETEGEILTIKVHNYGNPIPEEKQDKIFEFLNTSGSSKGGPAGEKSWGMGLTLVKVVAEGHGGEVKYESNEKDGTTFSIILDKAKNKPGKVRARLKYEFPEM